MLFILIADAAGKTQAVGLVIAIIVFMVGVGGAIFIQSRTTGLTQTVAAMNDANGELRAIIADNKVKFLEKDAEHSKEISDLRVAHTAEVTRLEGKLEALTGDIAEKLVQAAADAAARVAKGES